MPMKFGFVGAGKVGCSLGKYLVEHGNCVMGYYSKRENSAKEAAVFTGTKAFATMKELVECCEGIFLTVPDGELVSVYETLKLYIQRPICLIHCSGLEESDIFYDIDRYHSFGYSIHPLLAINSKYESYQELSNAVFTIEGNKAHMDELKSIFYNAGNEIVQLSASDKKKYHAAAVFSSNLVLGLLKQSLELLTDCGFDDKQARKAIRPLMLGNVEHALEQGLEDALTGPIERNDVSTVIQHQQALSKTQRKIYDALSLELVEVAKKKHPGREYKALEDIL